MERSVVKEKGECDLLKVMRDMVLMEPWSLASMGCGTPRDFRLGASAPNPPAKTPRGRRDQVVSHLRSRLLAPPSTLCVDGGAHSVHGMESDTELLE